MTTEPQPENRMLCDNLSYFLAELGKANSLSDVQLVLQNNTRHLFNFCVCRIAFFQQNQFVCYTITSEMPAVVTGTYQLLWDVEKLLFCEGLPMRLNACEHEAIIRNLPCKNRVDKLWGWKLNYADDAGILLTILTDEENPFSRKHVSLVKMICKMLFTKIQLIILLQTIQQNEVERMLADKQLERLKAALC